jgi:hypothetical protein
MLSIVSETREYDKAFLFSMLTGLFICVEVADLPEVKQKYCRGPEKIKELDRHTLFMAEFRHIDEGRSHPYKLFAKIERGKYWYA